MSEGGGAGVSSLLLALRPCPVTVTPKKRLGNMSWKFAYNSDKTNEQSNKLMNEQTKEQTNEHTSLSCQTFLGTTCFLGNMQN